MTAAITVQAIELVRVALPLVRPFRTPFGVPHERDPCWCTCAWPRR